MIVRESSPQRLVLASGSPRRQQLLSVLGLPFVTRAAAVDEEPMGGETPEAMVLRVAQAKAWAVPEVRQADIVIAADTTVALEGKAMGKPIDGDHAVHMLRTLRGRPHSVLTAIVAWQPESGRLVSEVCESGVLMRDYTDHELLEYVASGDPLDKAGAYAIQHPGFDPVARVDGCWLNVMGLPLCHLARALVAMGVAVPADVPGGCQAFAQHACDLGPEIVRWIARARPEPRREAEP